MIGLVYIVAIILLVFGTLGFAPLLLENVRDMLEERRKKNGRKKRRQR